jgi:antitoxin CcdA
MAAAAPKSEKPSIPRKLLDEALRLDVEIGRRSEEQLRQAVRKAWIEENREAIEACNAWVEKHGLPLAKYRQF